MYEIDWKKKARKQLDKIGDSGTRKEIKNAVATLADWPQVRNVKPLISHQYSFRLRVGRYRVFFEVAEVVQVV